MSLLSNCGFLLAEGAKSERRKCFPPLMAPPPWEHFQPLSINTWQWSKSRPAPPIYLLLCFNGNECVGGSNRGFFLSDQWTLCSDHLLRREWCAFSEVFLVFLQNKRSVCSFFFQWGFATFPSLFRVSVYRRKILTFRSHLKHHLDDADKVFVLRGEMFALFWCISVYTMEPGSILLALPRLFASISISNPGWAAVSALILTQQWE